MSSDFFQLLYFITSIHVILLLVDYLLKIRWSSQYSSFRRKSGINIQPFRILWFSTVFNRWFQKFGNWRPSSQKKWFISGVWITMILFPLALYFVLQSVYILFVVHILKDDKTDKKVAPFLEPAVPGINIPLSDACYYVSALLICSIFHEIGHAIAATREGARISGVGIFLLFLIPIAYVRMEGLENLSFPKQLRILCAGIWHNIVLVAGASAVLLLIPWLFYPFYDTGNGIQVTSIREKSPLSKNGGLKVDDVILSINNCEVTNRNTWIKCLQRVLKSPVAGYCITSDFINKNDKSIKANNTHIAFECCGNETASNICFEQMKKENNTSALPKHVCLKARTVIKQQEKECYSSGDCLNTYCLRPHLTNGTKLTEIHRKNDDDVLFLGHPVEIMRDVFISEYVKSWYLSVSIPNSMLKFCNFIIMFSGALATLNLTPCFHLDGQHIVRVLVDLCLITRIKSRNVRLVISFSITCLGSCVLVVYSILVLFSMFVR